MFLIVIHLENLPSVNHVLKVNSTKPKFSSSSRRAEEPLGLVHIDLCGKMNEKPLSGAEYFLTFVTV